MRWQQGGRRELGKGLTCHRNEKKKGTITRSTYNPSTAGICPKEKKALKGTKTPNRPGTDREKKQLGTGKEAKMTRFGNGEFGCSLGGRGATSTSDFGKKHLQGFKGVGGRGLPLAEEG